MSESWTHHRARVANAVQRGDAEEAESARRDLKAARAEDYIRELVDSAPPLTDDQRSRLSALLQPAGAR